MSLFNYEDIFLMPEVLFFCFSVFKELLSNAFFFYFRKIVLLKAVKDTKHIGTTGIIETKYLGFLF